MRKSWAFDKIFWKFLDERFFGVREEGVDEEDLCKSRVGMLTKPEIKAMEIVVKRKLKESEERILVEWEEAQVIERLNEMLIT